MSRVDDLIENYERFAELPWESNLAPAQRVWMAVYEPDQERRLRLHLPEFGNATKKAGHDWELIDISYQFEDWMSAHPYREKYFANPKLMQPALTGFFDHLAAQVGEQVRALTGANTVLGLVGAGSLFGLGQKVRVSALVERIEADVQGRLLLFFPGEVEGNNFRLMGAQDGWNYHAVVITAEKG